MLEGFDFEGELVYRKHVLKPSYTIARMKREGYPVDVIHRYMRPRYHSDARAKK